MQNNNNNNNNITGRRCLGLPDCLCSARAMVLFLSGKICCCYCLIAAVICCYFYFYFISVSPLFFVVNPRTFCCNKAGWRGLLAVHRFVVHNHEHWQLGWLGRPLQATTTTTTTATWRNLINTWATTEPTPLETSQRIVKQPFVVQWPQQRYCTDYQLAYYIHHNILYCNCGHSQCLSSLSMCCIDQYWC